MGKLADLGIETVLDPDTLVDFRVLSALLKNLGGSPPNAHCASRIQQSLRPLDRADSP